MICDQLYLFGNTETSNGVPSDNFNESDRRGSIGERVFDLECLVNKWTILESKTNNSKIDRWIYVNEKYFRVHIKTTFAESGPASFTLACHNGQKRWRGSGRYERKLAAQAEYFVCICFDEERFDWCMWWLPYEQFKETQVLSISHRHDCFMSVPAELRTEVYETRN